MHMKLFLLKCMIKLIDDVHIHTLRTRIQTLATKVTKPALYMYVPCIHIYMYTHMCIHTYTRSTHRFAPKGTLSGANLLNIGAMKFG